MLHLREYPDYKYKPKKKVTSRPPIKTIVKQIRKNDHKRKVRVLKQSVSENICEKNIRLNSGQFIIGGPKIETSSENSSVEVSHSVEDIKVEIKEEQVTMTTESLPVEESFYFSYDSIKYECPNIAILLDSSKIELEESLNDQLLPNLQTLTSLDLIPLPQEEMDYLSTLPTEDWESQSPESGCQTSHTNMDYTSLKFEYDDIFNDFCL